MPVYEFYCESCHMIFNFLSRSVNTAKKPDCPKCGRHALDRQVSRFAFSRGMEKGEQDEGMPEFDEARMERAMASLAGDMEGLDENDPRAMAHFMRKFSDATGMNLGGQFEEAIRRLEAGESPERIEEELGGLMDGEGADSMDIGDIFRKQGIGGLKKRLAAPVHDERLYPL